MEKNLTTGSVFANTVLFSLPFLLSYFLQTLYGMADLFIIGRFDETASITAVAIGSQVMHMITVMIVGLSMGTTVATARAVGGGRPDKAAKAAGNTATLFLLGSAAFSAILVLCARSITAWLSTPPEAAAETVQYLVICFAGIPFITAYNIISAVYRGLGDSRSPMYFVAVACLINIALDYLFIGGMDMGAAGAALATTLSQTVSACTALAVIASGRSGLRPALSDFKLKWADVAPILRVGVPISLQDGFIQIAFIIVTVIANMRGLNDAAAVGIVEKLICMLFLVPSSMLSAVSALAAQNIGAKRYDRAQQTLFYGILISCGFAVLVIAGSELFAPQLLSLFDSNAEVIRSGCQYLRGYILDALFVGIHFCFSGYFCACEHSGISFLHNSLSIILIRIPGSWLASSLYPDTLFPMGLAAPAGSLLSVIICIAAFAVLEKRRRKRLNA